MKMKRTCSNSKNIAIGSVTMSSVIITYRYANVHCGRSNYWRPRYLPMTYCCKTVDGLRVNNCIMFKYSTQVVGLRADRLSYIVDIPNHIMRHLS